MLLRFFMDKYSYQVFDNYDGGGKFVSDGKLDLACVQSLVWVGFKGLEFV